MSQADIEPVISSDKPRFNVQKLNMVNQIFLVIFLGDWHSLVGRVVDSKMGRRP